MAGIPKNKNSGSPRFFIGRRYSCGSSITFRRTLSGIWAAVNATGLPNQGQDT